MPLLVIGVVVIIIFSGAGGVAGWLSNLFSPGGEPPEQAPAAAPVLGTPTPIKTPTAFPTATPLPTWPLPPTPDPGRPPDPPPPAPTDIAPPDATATEQAYEDAEHSWEATATAEVQHWQQTAVAGYATQTALVPTPTPPPPTPVGGGPYGWPIDPYCRGRDGCASGQDGIRLVTQRYACTDYEEYLCLWCQNAANNGDYRFNGDVPNPRNWWHRGIDLDTGVDPGKPGEALLPTIDGVVIFAGISAGGINTGCGQYVVLGDTSDKYTVRYCHMSLIADAVNVSTGADLGRPWQAGDRIKPYTDSGQRIIIGYSGSTGYSTGPHLHYQIERRLEIGMQDVNPLPYIQRQNAQTPEPTPDPPY